MKVYKMTIMVVDFDGLGEDGITSAIENTKYPNWCIAPSVEACESAEVDWSDDHPLNNAGSSAEFARLFKEGE